MGKRVLLTLFALVLASAVAATPAWSQCWVCHCCDEFCSLGSQFGQGGQDGFDWKACFTGCGEPCDPGEEDPEEVAAFDVDAVWDELSTMDLNTIRILMNAHPTRVTLNAERKAVQVIGCNNGVVGHLQLPKEAAAALITEEEI